MERQDGFINTILGHGLERRDPFTSYSFGASRHMTDQEMDDLYSYNGIAAKIIDMPANEALRAGFELKDGEAVLDANEAVNSVFEDLQGSMAFSKALSWDRLFGGAIVLMMVDDGGELEEPLNLNSIKKIERLEVFDASDITFNDAYLYQDPFSQMYGKPEFYTLVNYYGTSMLVHESRCIVFNGARVSNRRRRARNGWGGREFDRIFDDIKNFSVGLNLSLLAASRLSQSVLKLSDMANLLASDEGEMQVRKRLQLIDMARHMMNTIAIDTDDDYDQKNINLSGLKEVIEQFEISLSAVTSIPATILFGRSPAGMNSTGDADFEAYYNMVERIQQTKLKPAISRLLEVMNAASEYRLNLPSSYTLEFCPLWNASEKEQAETANIKAQAKEHEANAAKNYMDMGVLDLSEVRQTLKTDSEYLIDDSLDDDLYDIAEQKQEAGLQLMNNAGEGDSDERGSEE